MKDSARCAGSAHRLENHGPFVKQADLITVGHEPLDAIFMFRAHGTQSHFTRGSVGAGRDRAFHGYMACHREGESRPDGNQVCARRLERGERTGAGRNMFHLAVRPTVFFAQYTCIRTAVGLAMPSCSQIQRCGAAPAERRRHANSGCATASTRAPHRKFWATPILH